MYPQSRGTLDAEIVIVPDGTVSTTFNLTDGAKKHSMKKTAKLTGVGELVDERNQPLAKISADGTLAMSFHEAVSDGVVVDESVRYKDYGTLGANGEYTDKLTGKQLSINDKGKVVGLPAEWDVIVTGAPTARKAAMFVLLVVFGPRKLTLDMSVLPGPAKDHRPHGRWTNTV